MINGDDPLLDLELVAAALGAASCGIAVADRRHPDQPLVYVNDRFLAMTGYARSEIIGRNCRFLQGPDTNPAIARQIGADIANHVDGSYRLLNYRRDGTTFWNDLRLVQVRDLFGSGHYILGILTDVTQEILNRENRQRFETLGLLAAGVAHEVNTPAQYISDNLHFVSEALVEILPLLDSAQRQAGPEAGGDQSSLAFLREELPLAIAQCQQGIAQIGQIVSAVRAFAYPGDEEMHPTDIGELVTQALTMTRSQWKYTATAELTPESVPISITCAGAEVLQVLVNLIINASQAIEDAQRGTAGRIAVSIHPSGGGAEIVIRDNGTGIAQEHLARVFDPHHTSKKPGRGTGLGLSISRRIVEERHGGTIRLASIVGEGTTATVRLPAQPRKMQEEWQPAPSAIA